MSSQGCPQVDRHGSHAFVKWQHQQQQLYKKMYPERCQKSVYISRYTSKGCPQVDQHGSHLFVQWQRQQQQLNPVINRTGSIGFVLKQRELQSLNRTTIDRVGSLGFVQLQRKQQQLYKQKMNGVAGKNEQQRCAPKENNGKMGQGHPQVDRHGSDQFIEWQKQQQQRYKQMKLKNPPKVDRNGSHDFVEWQQKQQELYKEMNPHQVDTHGSHEFIEWQHEKQLLHRQIKLGNPPKVDQHGSQEFVEWQQKQQQLYKEMNGIAEKVSNDAFYTAQILQDITGQTLRTKFMV